MKILNVKLTKGRKELRASIAVNNSRPIEEFLNLLQTALSIPDAVVLGFKDSEGVLLVPNFICSCPELLRSDDYEIILKEKPAPTRPEEQFSHIISEILIKNKLNDEEYFLLRTWMRKNNQMIGQVYQTFLLNHDIDGFLEWLLKSAGIKNQTNSTTEVPEPNPREKAAKHSNEERPSTTRAGDRPRTSNQERKSYQRYLQVMWEMEAQGFLEQTAVGLIKAMILRESFDIMREFDYYFLHNISLSELGSRLQKLADKHSVYLERPSSPMPKNNQIQFLVENFVREHLISAEDAEVLKKLISEENEFVFSAYDVFESDKDQGELVDSLIRAIGKTKRGEEGHMISESFYSEPPQGVDEI